MLQSTLVSVKFQCNNFKMNLYFRIETELRFNDNHGFYDITGGIIKGFVEQW